MTNLNIDSVRGDFLNANNGAIKLSEDELKSLDNLCDEILMKHQHEEGDSSFNQNVQKIAEHYVAIVDGKQREVVGTTYNKLKDIFTSIIQSGYFDRSHKSLAKPIEQVCIMYEKNAI